MARSTWLSARENRTPVSRRHRRVRPARPDDPTRAFGRLASQPTCPMRNPSRSVGNPRRHRQSAPRARLRQPVGFANGQPSHTPVTCSRPHPNVRVTPCLSARTSHPPRSTAPGRRFCSRFSFCAPRRNKPTRQRSAPTRPDSNRNPRPRGHLTGIPVTGLASPKETHPCHGHPQTNTDPSPP